MIPSVLARQLKKGLGGYLHTTFPIATLAFKDTVKELIDDPRALFQGPYVTVALPFRPGSVPEGRFEAVTFSFPPYVHQAQAFERLTGASPKSTLIATGTGSGKTESFLLPILEQSWQARQSGQKGIKAILIYPMNALATDQARRLAELIHSNPKLRGVVTAGLYVGEQPEHPSAAMTPDGVITDKSVLRDSPPDILLTNYKMLDLMLVRPKDAKIWQHNAPETLRYLVVDELHTFDGAQGTDLACLIRRLKARLGTPEGRLCAVGTSATLGGDSGAEALLGYASEVFGERFDAEAPIGETRLSSDEFLALDGEPVDDASAADVVLPDPGKLLSLMEDPALAPIELAQRMAPLFFPELTPVQNADDWACALGKALRRHPLLQAILRVLDGKTRHLGELAEQIGGRVPGFAEAPLDSRVIWVECFLALLAAARIPGAKGPRSFVQLVRIQLWLREMRRMVASVLSKPKLVFSHDLPASREESYLPMVHCRDCGATGWGGFRESRGSHAIQTGLDDIYRAYFGRDAGVTFLYPDAKPVNAGVRDGVEATLCPVCMQLQSQKQPHCTHCPPDREGNGVETIAVWIPDSTEVSEEGRTVGTHDCAYCGSSGGVGILGAQAATLTSVLIDQLFVGRANDDKKLLTFSDSVQDAAHRAGFFGARTHSVVRRAAIWQAIAAQPAPPTLAELPDLLFRYWSERWSPAEVAARLLPPDMHYLRDFGALAEGKDLPSDHPFWGKVRNRLQWEVLREFGLRARVGRTLEKSRLVILRLPAKALNEAVMALHSRLQQEFDSLRTLKDGELRRFLLGVIRRMRLQGGILTPLTHWYLEQGGKTFAQYAWGFNLNGMPPAFPGTLSTRFLDAIVAVAPRESWYQRWAQRCWGAPDRVMLNADVAEALPRIFQVLADRGLLRRVDSPRGHAYGLPGEHLLLTRDVTALVCSSCRQHLHAPDDEVPIWTDAPCVRLGCQGTYQLDARAQADYFAKLYGAGEVAPVVAREHTGLLSRDVREELEKAFKREDDRTPWDPNVLSCTPTFEMGLDVGDLSSLILCQVPPAQANYLQRIGRAGRRDGNALVLTVANARAHDLYFFAEPEEMIQGQVKTPGIYLNAAMVIERQLAAYCFDRWVATGIPDAAIPAVVGDAIAAMKAGRANQFPVAFLEFVKLQEAGLLEDFLALFPHLEQDAREHLQGYLTGDSQVEGSLRYRISEALSRAQREIDAQKKSYKTLQAAIKELKESVAKPQDFDERLRQLYQERNAVDELTKALTRRELFGFLTDEGVLPNYAFPEAGIRLQSIIYRKKENLNPDPSVKESKYETTTYEYQRPARAALSELAPQAYFYAEGRKVQIDQVDLNLSETEVWRFCPGCSHAERLAGGSETATCPRCGHAGWADAGQKREMLRLRQVYATTEDSRSRSDDARDEREPSFFKRQFLVEVEPADVLSAHRLVDEHVTFGVEFARRVTLRDVNTGEAANEGLEWHLSGKPIRTRGFTVCRECGKVKKGKATEHAYTCRYRGQEEAAGFEKVLFLYREFRSEAVRLLLPMADISDEVRLQSFVAAFHLGLRLRFKGGIDHLESAISEEAVPDSPVLRRYLALYDTVPGGTGYLKQLGSHPDELLDVLRRALAHLKACGCQDRPEADGCYRCLFAYRHARNLDKLSRRKAIEVIAPLVGRTAEWEEVATVGAIGSNSLIESVLEERFIQALGKVQGAGLSKDVVNGKPGWLYQLGDQHYQIEPQRAIKSLHSAGTLTRPDFVFWPLRRASGQRAIAVYLDGLAYHKDQVREDLAKREALRVDAAFWVWTLGAADVAAALGEQGALGAALNPLDPVSLPMGGQLNTLVQRFGLETRAELSRRWLGGDAFQGLIQLLRDPGLAVGAAESPWARLALAWCYASVDPARRLTAEKLKELTDALPDATPGVALAEVPEPALMARLSEGALDFLAALAPTSRTGQTSESVAILVLDARETRRAQPDWARSWLGFWRLWNLFQVLPGFHAVADDGSLEMRVSRVPQAPYASQAFPEDAAWDEAVDLVTETWRELALALRAAGLPAPSEPGLELTGPKGEVLGSAELAWPDFKIALMTPMEWEHRAPFEALGWRVVALEDMVTDPKLLEGLKLAWQTH